MVKRVQPTTEQIHELVRTNPLGLVITHVDGEALSTLLPIVLDPSGEMLHGHFGAKNPQIDALREHPRALLIFQGPSSYISPSWLRDRTQAPTWFYTFVEFQVAIDFIDDERGVRQNLEQLVAHLEEGHGSRWHLTELGERYAMLSRGVRPFTARILAPGRGSSSARAIEQT